MSVTRDQVLEALREVVDPTIGRDIVSAEMAKAIAVSEQDEGAKVSFVIEVDPAKGPMMEPVRAAAEAAVKALEGVAQVSAVLTAHSGQPSAPAPRPAPKGPPPELKTGRRKPTEPASKKVPGVDRIIAVASGKGGVGKSTVTSNLAVALSTKGYRVGLLDADVYGPSQPRMLGISGKPSTPDGKIIIPLKNHGVTAMSIGFMVPEGEAVVWRGPMLMGALQQMLAQVQWGRLDVLLVDLPPGTGDVQLTLSQKAEVTGAVIVSTPQDIALLDARKAVDMFRKTDVPILGVIENMSRYICPKCGHEEHIFGEGGARAEAEKIGAPFLGEIPLDLAIRQAGDDGTPIVAHQPASPQARAFLDVAEKLAESGALKPGAAA